MFLDLVPIQLCNQLTGVFVEGDVGGIVGQKVSADLRRGIVALFCQRFGDDFEGFINLLFCFLTEFGCHNYNSFDLMF